MGEERTLDTRTLRTVERTSAGSDLDRKYWVALGLYAGLAVAAWFMMDEGKVLISGRPVEMRWIPLVVIGGFALRTVLARKAEKIRRETNGNS